MLDEFDEDSFFSGPFRAHREHMRQMMHCFSEPFGSHFSTHIIDGRNRGRDEAEYRRPPSNITTRIIDGRNRGRDEAEYPRPPSNINTRIIDGRNRGRDEAEHPRPPSHFSTRIIDGRNRGRDMAEHPRPSSNFITRIIDGRNRRRDMAEPPRPSSHSTTRIMDGRNRGRDMAEPPRPSSHFSSRIIDGRNRGRDMAEPPRPSSHFSSRIIDGRNRGQNMAEPPRPSFDGRTERRDMSQSLLPFGSTDMMQNPVSMFDSMMCNMGTSMDEMKRGFDVLPAANGHSFRSSSVMSVSKVGDEPPKIFQATTSTRCAPGGIKETRQAVKDSESGLEKVKIGHQIKDRQHVIEKRHNTQTGDQELKQDFVNMDESEADSFDDEWQRKASRLQSPVHIPVPVRHQLSSPVHPCRSQRKRMNGRQGSGSTNEYRY